MCSIRHNDYIVMCRIGHMLKNEADDRSITIRILRSLYEEVSRIVARRNVYSNEADFIRDAIREKLEREMGGRKN